MKPRFLLPPDQLVASARVALPAEAAHHAVRVLRLGTGALLEVFDGAGRSAAAIVLSADRDRCTIEIDAAIMSSVAMSGLHITLLQGIAAADRMDWIIEKSIELGVARVIPMMTQRSTVKLDPERAKKRHLHWQRIAVAACMQCGQDHLPKIEAPLPARIAFSDRVSDPGQRLILDPLAQDSLVQTVRSRLVSDQAIDQANDQANDQAGRGRWVMAVGPESGQFGWDPEYCAPRPLGQRRSRHSKPYAGISDPRLTE